MKLAVAKAYEGMRKNHGGPFGAVIVRGSHVVAKAHNRVLQKNDPTAHAEMLAIRAAAKKLNSYDLSDCELYTTCEPCPMCLGAVYWSRIPRIYCGCTRKDAAKIGFKDKDMYAWMKKRKPATVQKVKLERRECLKPFREWARKKDRVIY
ncbi:MAG: nucleoside deaminase [Acidobacteriota bacterium]